MQKILNISLRECLQESINKTVTIKYKAIGMGVCVTALGTWGLHNVWLHYKNEGAAGARKEILDLLEIGSEMANSFGMPFSQSLQKAFEVLSSRDQKKIIKLLFKLLEARSGKVQVDNTRNAANHAGIKELDYQGLLSEIEKNSAIWNVGELGAYFNALMAVIEDKIALYAQGSEHDYEKSREFAKKAKCRIEKLVGISNEDLNFNPKELSELLLQKDEKLAVIYADILYRLGRVYIYEKKYKKNEQLYKEVETLFETSKAISQCYRNYHDNKKAVFTEILSVQNGLGILYLETGQYDKAIVEYTKLLKSNAKYYDVIKDSLMDLSDNSTFRSDCMWKLSNCYARLTEHGDGSVQSYQEKSLTYMVGQKDCRVLDKDGNRIEGALWSLSSWLNRKPLNSLAYNVVHYLKDYPELYNELKFFVNEEVEKLSGSNLAIAEAIYKKSLLISEQYNANDYLVPEAEHGLAEVYLLQKKFKEALFYAERSIESHKRMHRDDSHEDMQQALELKAKIEQESKLFISQEGKYHER